MSLQKHLKMQTIFVAIVTTLLEMGKKPWEVRAALCAAVDSRWVLAAGSPTLPTAAVGLWESCCQLWVPPRGLIHSFFGLLQAQTGVSGSSMDSPAFPSVSWVHVCPAMRPSPHCSSAVNQAVLEEYEEWLPA